MAEPSAKSLERSRQKESAEQERTELRKKLLTLKEDIGKTEKARGHAADSLATSEAAISNANRSLRELAAEQEKTKKRILELSSKIVENYIHSHKSEFNTIALQKTKETFSS